MIELYVLMALGAIGYYLNTNSNTVKTSKYQIHRNEKPSMNNIYDSNYSTTANNITQRKASKKFNESQNPKESRVIGDNYYFTKDLEEEDEENTRGRNRDALPKVRSLTGDYMDTEAFTHNNMVPFFGGSIKQNMNDQSNRVLLENYTGIQDIQKNKCETTAFFKADRDVANVNGMQNNDDFYKDRIAAPRLRNNEFPIPQMNVGPGLGLGYNNTPTGGYQQFEAQEFVRDKCVDELRTKTNPNPNALGIADNSKQTYDARTLDGMKGTLRGEVAPLSKNRVETFFEQTPDMLLKTTGANTKPAKNGQFNVKDTNRQTTSKEHMGTAYASTNLARTVDSDVQASNRQQFIRTNFGIANMEKVGKATKDDYGKSRIMVYTNERDITTTRVYQGNVTSIVKAIVAPFEDIIKVTKKQHTVDNPRHFGNMSIQLPKKATVYDPSDVARTTIKQTTIHEAVLGNLKGAEKGIVHDPNDVARTTVKQTTIHEAVLGNLKGAEKGVVHDPSDVARTTTKETTIHDTIIGNLKGAEKITVYDPSDVARTTIKETLIHDDMGSGTVTGAKQLYVYDPDEVARKTGRETLDRESYEANLAGRVYKGKVYDPEDVLRTTNKETLVGMGRDYGNVDGLADGGGYETANMEAKMTQKQFLSDNDYIGQVARDKGEGYITNKYDAKETQKQFLSDIEYFGHALAGEDKKQMSYDAMENADISAAKEVTLFGREPTQTGNKVFNDCINVATPKKQECDQVATRNFNNQDRVYNTIPYLDDNTVTKTRKNVDMEIGDRLDISLLDAFKNNPYTQSLSSVA